MFLVTMEPELIAGQTVAMVTVPASAANSVIRFVNNSAFVNEGITFIFIIFSRPYWVVRSRLWYDVPFVCRCSKHHTRTVMDAGYKTIQNFTDRQTTDGQNIVPQARPYYLPSGQYGRLKIVPRREIA